MRGRARDPTSLELRALGAHKRLERGSEGLADRKGGVEAWVPRFAL